MEEHRKYVRIDEKAQITYSVISSVKSKQYITSNISQGGIRFFVHDFIPKGSYLKIKMTFSRADATIEAVVELVWISEVPYSDRHEVGVKFVDIPAESADHLVNYIRSFVNTKFGTDRNSA